jgi:tetratricopeptide (TPR) repeat protein
MLQRDRSDWTGAEAILRRALAMSRRVAPDRDLTASALTNLAVTLLDEKNYDGAEPLFQEAIAINRRLHGDLYRNVPRNLGNLALVRRARGDLKGAEDYWMEALRLERQMLPEGHPDIAWNVRLLGQVKEQEGDLPSAEKYFRESLEMERKNFGNQHLIVADILGELARVLRAEGRHSEADPLEMEAMRIRLARETAQLAAHPNDASHRADLARAQLRCGDFKAALTSLNRATSLDPSNQWYWFLTACLRCHLGDSRGYQDACAQLLDRFGASEQASIAERTAKACVLSSSGPKDLDRVNRLADRAVASGGPYAAWFYLCKGLAEYRAGHYPAAHEWFTKAAGLDDEWGAQTVKLLLAMTEFRLGNTARAQDGYRAVIDRLATLPKPGDGDLGSEPENYLVFEILRREAAAMLDPTVATSQPVDH